MARLPGNHNFKVKRGSAWSETVTWKIDGTGVNLSGWTVTLRLRPLTGDVEFSSPANVSVDGSGNITWTVPQASMTALTADFVDYDLRAVQGVSIPEWLLAGTLEVIP